MYDARSNTGGRSGNIFGLALGGVVAVGFLAVLAWPRGAPAAPQTSASPAAVTMNIAGVKSKADQHMLASVKALDEDAYKKLEIAALKTGTLGGSNLEMTNEVSMEVLLANADALAKADVKYFDELIVRVRDGLKSAQKSGSKWCKGSFLASLEGKNEAQIMRMVGTDFNGNPAFNDWVIDTNAWMLDVIVEAKKNPVSYGAMTRSDQTALQGVVMSLMSDPKVMQLVMSAQGDDPAKALEKANVCELGALAMTAAKTLPKDTKGRLWAETFKQMKSSGGDLTALQSMSGL